MRSVVGALALAGCVAAPAVAASGSHDVQVTPRTFHAMLAERTDSAGRLSDHTQFLLSPGEYRLVPSAYVDSTCGNCEDPRTLVEASVGARLSGAGILVTGTGSGPEEVVIHTGAGYGILFEDCEGCVLQNVSVTGGVRDADGNATDAAVVVKRSSVRIEACRIADNIGAASRVAEVVVGIIGIAGREGARIDILRNAIVRNSWDGIALYRGAQATIEENLIDGVDKARGKRIGGGRGVGIGVTWDARASIRRNRVTRYWKGIGIFVDARADVQENVVEEVLTWGIAYWDAGRGRPVARIERNVVFDTGACGISITRQAGGEPSPGACRDNLVFRTGQDPKYDDPEYYCIQTAVAIQSRPEGFAIERNVLFGNRRAPETLPDHDLPPDEFARRARPWVARLSALPSLRDSRCLGEIRAMLDAGGRPVRQE
ncbi:MAG: right-handed parallel beta-helix repeat-containing protein [Candidatus Krumholzibacteriia bacterium]